jgi:hypothetical protein
MKSKLGASRQSQQSIIQYIDTTTIVAFEFDYIQTYTFKVVPTIETENTFYNIIFYQNKDGMQSKLLKYVADYDYLNNLDSSFSGTIYEIEQDETILNTYVAINDTTSDLANRMMTTCAYSTSIVSVNCSGDNHYFGDPEPCKCGTQGHDCTPAYQYTVMDMICVTYTTGGGSNPGDGSSSGGGGTSTDDPNQNDNGTYNLPTEPVKGTGNWNNDGSENENVALELVNNFYNNSLSYLQEIIYLQNPSIKEYLLQNIIEIDDPLYIPRLGGNPTKKVIDPQAVEFVIELIDLAIANNYNSNPIEELSEIIDILDDGNINGQQVVVAPDTPITNMTQYLSIFNTSIGATITIYADQPVNNTDRIISPNDGVGHAFISIQQGTKVVSLGFYPQSSPGSIIPNTLTLDPTDFFPTAGAFGNDGGHDYDVSLSVPINAAALANLINGITNVANSNPLYNLGSLNCTDMAILFFESGTNINIPSCESPSIWSGQTSRTLGQILKGMTTPTNGMLNTFPQNAPLNSTN